MRRGYIKVPRELLDSPECRALSDGAHRVFVDLWSCCYGDKNNGRISYGMSNIMNSFGYSKSKAQRIFQELKASPLVEVTVPGSFNHKDGARLGLKTLWLIPNFPKGKKHD
jgi:hypothetical protein